MEDNLWEDELWWKMTFDGRHLWWKATSDGRRLLTEDDFWQKTTFDGRQLLMEDYFWLKTSFDGRRFLMEDDLCWKTTFDGKQPLMEDSLWWKTTFDGRRSLVKAQPGFFARKVKEKKADSVHIIVVWGRAGAELSLHLTKMHFRIQTTFCQWIWEQLYGGWLLYGWYGKDKIWRII